MAEEVGKVRDSGLIFATDWSKLSNISPFFVEKTVIKGVNVVLLITSIFSRDTSGVT